MRLIAQGTGYPDAVKLQGLLSAEGIESGMTAGALAIYYYEQDSRLSLAEWTAKVFEVFELSGISGSISAGETLSERRFTNPESYKSELVSYGVDPDSI